MSDETSKEETQNQTLEGAQVQTTESKEASASPEYSAKAQEDNKRTRVAYAEGFEPTAQVKQSGDATEKKPVQTAEDMTASALPEAGDVTTDDFAAMFEGAASATPVQRRYDVGDQVQGMVEHIDTNYIFVDMGGRGEGRASRAQFTNEEGELEIALGDQYTFYILAIKADGIVLGKHLDDRDSGVFAVEQAMEAGLPVQGKVTGTNKGGFDVEVLGVTAFCPRSQIDLYASDDADIYINQTFEFRVIDVRDGGRNVVVSRSALMREAAEARRAETMELIKPDAVLTGVVRSISDYGAFVDLGGIDGLVHISELTWGTISHPNEVVTEGQQVDVKILSIEEREKGTRISLSIKQAGGDPWDDVNASFAVGQDVEGTVVRLTHYGAFVELKAGVDGLVHISEISWKRVSKPSDVLSVGEKVTVKIKDIDLAKRRLSLSMREAKGDPWSKIEEKYAVGQKVEGQVEKVEDFGAFIVVEEGVTALLPRSEMALSGNATPRTAYRQGQDVSAFVLRVESDRRRMALTTKEDAQGESARPQRQQSSNKKNKGNNKNKKQQQSKGGQQESFGTLADLFKKNK